MKAPCSFCSRETRMRIKLNDEMKQMNFGWCTYECLNKWIFLKAPFIYAKEFPIAWNEYAKTLETIKKTYGVN